MAGYPLGVPMDQLTPEQRAAKLEHHERQRNRAAARWHGSLLSSSTGGHVSPLRHAPDHMAATSRAFDLFVERQAHEDRYGLGEPHPSEHYR